MESITKSLDKNLSQLRNPWGEEILTLIQAGILGPAFPFFLMNNSWLFLLLYLIHQAFFTFLPGKSELLLIGTCLVINVIILFDFKKIRI